MSGIHHHRPPSPFWNLCNFNCRLPTSFVLVALRDSPNTSCSSPIITLHRASWLPRIMTPAYHHSLVSSIPRIAPITSCHRAHLAHHSGHHSRVHHFHRFRTPAYAAAGSCPRAKLFGRIGSLDFFLAESHRAFPFQCVPSSVTGTQAYSWRKLHEKPTQGQVRQFPLPRFSCKVAVNIPLG